ncbi:MAG: glycosyltransferase family 4 protein [Candidatus Cyclobacteriaceae bacterium M3_2C_046]
MHILILVSSLNFGGAEKQAVLDANMLSQKHQVTFAVFETGKLAESLNPGVKLVELKKDNYLKTALRLTRLIRHNHIDIIHNHLFAPMVISALSSLKVQVPVIWHFHGHHFEVNKPTLSILSRLPQVKKLLFVCDPLRQYFMEHFHFPARKTDIVYNSTQSGKFSMNGTLDMNRFNIGFIGRLVGLKRVEYLLELAGVLKNEQISDFNIHILGDGPERASLEEKASQLNVTREVRFWGFQTDLVRFYNQFDLFILPSQEEALSLSLIDAGSTGLPSIAFDVGGNKEIIQDQQTGYIVDSKQELFTRTLQLYHDQALRQKMGDAALSYSKVFSEEAHLEKLESIYYEFV